MMAPTRRETPDPVGAAVDRPLDPVGAGHHRLHRLGILGAEIEDLPDLDAARVQPLVRRNLALEARGVVHVLGRGIERGPLADDAACRSAS